MNNRPAKNQFVEEYYIIDNMESSLTEITSNEITFKNQGLWGAGFALYTLLEAIEITKANNLILEATRLQNDAEQLRQESTNVQTANELLLLEYSQFSHHVSFFNSIEEQTAFLAK